MNPVGYHRISRRRTDKQLRRTATHEAGHAVIGRVLGLTCGSASIVPNWKFAGYSETEVERSIDDWDKRGRDRTKSMLRARIMMLMAGREAEVVFLGRDGRGDANDRLEIFRTLEDVGFGTPYQGKAPNRWLARLRKRTRHLVRRHKAAIERIASELLKRNKLGKRGLDTLVRRTGTYIPGRNRARTISFKLRYGRVELWRKYPVSGQSDWWNRVRVMKNGKIRLASKAKAPAPFYIPAVDPLGLA